MEYLECARSHRASILAFSALTAVLLTACGNGDETDDDADASVAEQDPAGDEGGSEVSEDLEGEIVWADFGGPTNESREEAYFDSFEEETGVDIVSTMVEQTVASQMLEGESGEYDAIHRSLEQVYVFQDGIAELPDWVTRDDELPENIQDYAFGTFFVGHAQGYMTETFPNGGPETWEDFFDTGTYPGQRAFPGSPASYDSSCEIALMGDGVAPEELYPLDFDRCFEKLDELRDDIIFYENYPEVQQLLTSGSAAVAAAPTGQYIGLINEGLDVEISWNQAVVAPNVMVIPEQAPNQENIFALAEWMSDPERQAAFAELTQYGVGNPEALDYMEEETIELLVNNPGHTEVVWQGAEERAEVRDEYIDRYTEWLAQ